MQVKNKFYFSMSGSIQTNTPFGTILEIAYLINGCRHIIYYILNYFVALVGLGPTRLTTFAFKTNMFYQFHHRAIYNYLIISGVEGNRNPIYRLQVYRVSHYHYHPINYCHPRRTRISTSFDTSI
jgi:hypothetical protein